jgi:hypothetical protein
MEQIKKYMQNRKLITSYCQSCEMDGVSYSTICTLYDNGFINSVFDLYKLSSRKNNLLTLELKPLSKPAPIYNQAAPMRVSWLQSGIDLFWGAEYRAHYFPVILNGVPYLRRPLWNGNEGVALDDLDSIGIKEISLHEAYTLGKLHAKSGPAMSTLKVEDLEKMGGQIESRWRAEMNE